MTGVKGYILCERKHVALEQGEHRCISDGSCNGFLVRYLKHPHIALLDNTVHFEEFVLSTSELVYLRLAKILSIAWENRAPHSLPLSQE